ncbi:MAG TPA: glycoside hydrolase family 36 protein [Terrimicrobiaceae bacterium]
MPRRRACKIGTKSLSFTLDISPEAPVKLLVKGSKLPEAKLRWARLVELQAAGFNHDDHHGNKYTGTNPAGLLRYLSHSQSRTGFGHLWEIKQSGSGLTVSSYFQFLGQLPACRTWTVVENVAADEILIEFVSSLALFGVSLGGASPWKEKMRLHVADNSWCSECQWRSGSLGEFGLGSAYRGREGSGFSLKRVAISNQGTWSSLEHLPLGALENRETNSTLCWQIEHNGSWHWELSDVVQELVLRVSGPTYRESLWSKRLAAGEKFESVPVTFVNVDGDLETALGILTRARRLLRRPHHDLETLPVIFNDYMNCLWGNPTTESLIPLIDKAAEIAAEYFVIDAGWYAEIGETWWESVGAWQPSITRFPSGLGEVIQRIRAKGMIPGLWLEIEVMGINCPLARQLPREWFFLREGKPVIDHGRYQLDFRNADVRGHADGIVERLIREFGIGYLKMDYNINGGPGTDFGADSPGDGLLEHNRAYLNWIRSVFDRHRDLVIENCSSGGLRMDYAQLSVHSLQSVSDQTDYRLNAVIAAACASAVTPEQAAVWSYPLKGADEEETIFNMVSTLLLRVHQSGCIQQISPTCLGLVKEGIAIYKNIRADIPKGIPFWPLGLQRFGVGWAAFGLDCGRRGYLAVWRLDGKNRSDKISLPLGADKATFQCIYPQSQVTKISKSDKSVTISLPQEYSARLFRFEKRRGSP